MASLPQIARRLARIEVLLHKTLELHGIKSVEYPDDPGEVTAERLKKLEHMTLDNYRILTGIMRALKAKEEK